MDYKKDSRQWTKEKYVFKKTEDVNGRRQKICITPQDDKSYDYAIKDRRYGRHRMYYRR